MSLHTSDLVLVPGQQLPPLETISGFQVRPGSLFRRDCDSGRCKLYHTVSRGNVL